MPDYAALPLSRIENAKKNHPAGLEEHHGAGEHAPAHGAEKKKEARLNAAKNFGGLS
jgi:hypothetical protein